MATMALPGVVWRRTHAYVAVGRYVVGGGGDTAGGGALMGGGRAAVVVPVATGVVKTQGLVTVSTAGVD